MDYFVLTRKNQVKEASQSEALAWHKKLPQMQKTLVGCKIAFSELKCEKTTHSISTVFSYTPFEINPPHHLVFETLIWLNKDNKQKEYLDFNTRCREYDEALEMHQKALNWIRLLNR